MTNIVVVGYQATGATLQTQAPQVLKVVAQGPQGPMGAVGPQGPAGTYFLSFPTATAIGGNRIVGLHAGVVVYASADAPTTASNVLGITTSSVAAGLPSTIQSLGLMTEPSWAWTPDKPVFCGLNGALTQTPPTTGFSLIVGLAVSTTQVFIRVTPPIYLQPPP